MVRPSGLRNLVLVLAVAVFWGATGFTVTPARDACKTTARLWMSSPQSGMKQFLLRFGVGKEAKKTLNLDLDTWRKPAAEEVLRTGTVVVGAGVSGLSCAKTLLDAGYGDFLVLESSDAVGGRVATDEVGGYLLDRGFQVFIEQYPESKKLFDYPQLNLKPFLPGAMVRYGGAFHLVSDPFRRPQDLLASAVSPIGTFIDKAKVGIYSLLIRTYSLPDIAARKEYPTSEYLARHLELSDAMIDRFFRPFFQGIYLSPLEEQSSRMFEFAFQMFTTGAATLPEGGMGAAPMQVAESLGGRVMCETRVGRIGKEGGGFVVQASRGGKALRVECERVVVAADPAAAQALLQVSASASASSGCLGAEARIDLPKARGSTCLYFGFNGPAPVLLPMLILNGDSRAQEQFSTTINNVCFPSQVSSKYAPAGKTLASVTLIGCDMALSDAQMGAQVQAQLREWWGEQVDSWGLLRVYRIPYAQPAQTPSELGASPVALGEGLYCVGDHRSSATLNGAISSGRLAAESILKSF